MDAIRPSSFEGRFKTAIMAIAKLDDKYSVLAKAKGSLEDALDKVKSQGNVDPDTVEKLESALSSTNAKIAKINDEYDLVGAGSTALGVIGDLVEKAVTKASELEKEYSLTDKAKEALSKAVDKAKASV
jgi:phage-related tail protein